ncbi:MAG: WD40 repeat domain-containing protein [Anaerolineae bacterium]
MQWTETGELLVLTSAGAWKYSSDQLTSDQPTPIRDDYSGKVIAVAGTTLFLSHLDRSVTALDLITEQERMVLPPSDETSLNIAVSAEGTKLAYVRSSFHPPVIVSEDNFAIHVLDIRNNREMQALQAETNRIVALQFSPDGTILGVASTDKRVRLWDLQEGVELQVFYKETTWPNSLAFSADGTMLAIGNVDGTIQLVEVQSGSTLQSFAAHNGFVISMAFSPDGHLLASGASDDHAINLWETSTGKLVVKLEVHQDWITALSFSSDGTLLVTASLDETIRTWDTDTWQLDSVVDGYTNRVTAVAFNPVDEGVIHRHDE